VLGADISVLLPTRNRPELLRSSINSLLNLAAQPRKIEILLAVDKDAPVDSDIAWLPGVTVWTAPERYGSARMQEYYNHLATRAAGQWLMIWNDDATMRTRGWDAAIRSAPSGACLWLDHMGTGPDHCNMFPVWPKAWTDVLGHVADGSPRVDTWVQEVAEIMGRQVKVPVQLQHISPDDQTHREGREYYLPEFHALRRLREQEAAELLAAGF
jgi:hypothetical protein